MIKTYEFMVMSALIVSVNVTIFILAYLFVVLIENLKIENYQFCIDMLVASFSICAFSSMLWAKILKKH